MGTIALGAEPRFKAAVLVLMLNGKDDSVFPVEASQAPFFEALSTPDKDKRHIVFAGGQVDFIDRLEVMW
jgi:alpha-beta hydrolase superfamily lysophospholipase